MGGYAAAPEEGGVAGHGVHLRQQQSKQQQSKQQGKQQQQSKQQQ